MSPGEGITRVASGLRPHLEEETGMEPPQKRLRCVHVGLGGTGGKPEVKVLGRGRAASRSLDNICPERTRPPAPGDKCRRSPAAFALIK